VPVDVASGVHAAGLEPPRVEVDDDALGPRQHAAAVAGAVADGRDPGARAVAVDGEPDGVEGEAARVRAREDGDANDAPFAAPEVPALGQRVARRRREQDAAARRRVDGEDAGQERRLGARVRGEEHEAVVDVLDGQGAGEALGEVEGEARGGGGGGVEREEDGGVVGLVRRRHRGWAGGALGVEEVAEERRHAWEREGGGAAPAVAGERRAEEVGGREADEDGLEDEVREVGDRRRRRSLHRWCRRQHPGARGSGSGGR